MADPSENPQRLPLRRAYPFLEARGLGDEVQTVRQSPGGSPVHRGHIIEILRQHDLLDEFIGAEWHAGATQAGRKAMERYVARYRRSFEEEEDDSPQEEEDPEETRFAYENQLRDYLANNLGLIEEGLSLWSDDEDGAVEFSIDERGRRVDILARDSNSTPVVIELKVSRGHERTIGQALYYAARVRERFTADGVRIVIVASEISPELSMATAGLDNVQLYEYRLQTTLIRVQ